MARRSSRTRTEQREDRVPHPQKVPVDDLWRRATLKGDVDVAAQHQRDFVRLVLRALLLEIEGDFAAIREGHASHNTLNRYRNKRYCDNYRKGLQSQVQSVGCIWDS